MVFKLDILLYGNILRMKMVNATSQRTYMSYIVSAFNTWMLLMNEPITMYGYFKNFEKPYKTNVEQKQDVVIWSYTIFLCLVLVSL